MNGYGSVGCACGEATHSSRFIVLTGGPGAGKTAVLESLKRTLCEHIAIIPESASIVFGGGFWRRESLAGRRAAQRAIYHVQTELETLVSEESRTAVALCDRGALDGIAYWPGPEATYFEELGVTKVQLLRRYELVIHLRTPSAANGYNHANPIRVETAAEARAIDDRILTAWEGHPRRLVIESRPDFLEKAAEVIETVRSVLPSCCRAHPTRS